MGNRSLRRHAARDRSGIGRSGCRASRSVGHASVARGGSGVGVYRSARSAGASRARATHRRLSAADAHAHRAAPRARDGGGSRCRTSQHAGQQHARDARAVAGADHRFARSARRAHGPRARRARCRTRAARAAAGAARVGIHKIVTDQISTFFRPIRSA